MVQEEKYWEEKPVTRYNNNTTTTIINKPDIIIHDNEKGTCMLTDAAISGDRNVIKKQTEKILKYKDLPKEIHRMWNVKTKVIRVITGVTGTISKSFRKHVETMKSRNHSKQPCWALHTYFGKY